MAVHGKGPNDTDGQENPPQKGVIESLVVVDGHPVLENVFFFIRCQGVERFFHNLEQDGVIRPYAGLQHDLVGKFSRDFQVEQVVFLDLVPDDRGRVHEAEHLSFPDLDQALFHRIHGQEIHPGIAVLDVCVERGPGAHGNGLIADRVQGGDVQGIPVRGYDQGIAGIG